MKAGDRRGFKGGGRSARLRTTEEREREREGERERERRQDKTNSLFRG